MNRIASVAAVLGCTFALCGCLLSPVVPPTGAIYSDIGAPQSLGPRAELGSKTGEASSTAILGMVSFGDCGVTAAAKNGGISKVHHTDYTFFNVLGIYQKYTTVVYGD